MENILSNKKTLILIIVLAIAALTFLFIRLFYVPPVPTPKYFSKAGPNPDVVPTIAPDQYGNGGQLDVNSPIVKESQQNIEIIKNKLPYKDDFKSSSGINVIVFIPARQISPSELDLSIDGINYLRDPSDPAYNNEKAAFLETVDRLYKWVQNNGANPNKIYFGWSDKKVFRDRIQEWLNSK